MSGSPTDTPPVDHNEPLSAAKTKLQEAKIVTEGEVGVKLKEEKSMLQPTTNVDLEEYKTAARDVIEHLNSSIGLTAGTKQKLETVLAQLNTEIQADLVDGIHVAMEKLIKEDAEFILAKHPDEAERAKALGHILHMQNPKELDISAENWESQLAKTLETDDDGLEAAALAAATTIIEKIKEKYPNGAKIKFADQKLTVYGTDGKAVGPYPQAPESTSDGGRDKILSDEARNKLFADSYEKIKTIRGKKFSLTFEELGLAKALQIPEAEQQNFITYVREQIELKYPLAQEIQVGQRGEVQVFGTNNEYLGPLEGGMEAELQSFLDQENTVDKKVQAKLNSGWVGIVSGMLGVDALSEIKNNTMVGWILKFLGGVKPEDMDYLPLREEVRDELEAKFQLTIPKDGEFEGLKGAGAELYRNLTEDETRKVETANPQLKDMLAEMPARFSDAELQKIDFAKKQMTVQASSTSEATAMYLFYQRKVGDTQNQIDTKMSQLTSTLREQLGTKAEGAMESLNGMMGAGVTSAIELNKYGAVQGKYPPNVSATSIGNNRLVIEWAEAEELEAVDKETLKGISTLETALKTNLFALANIDSISPSPESARALKTSAVSIRLGIPLSAIENVSNQAIELKNGGTIAINSGSTKLEFSRKSYSEQALREYLAANPNDWAVKVASPVAAEEEDSTPAGGGDAQSDETSDGHETVDDAGEAREESNDAG